MATVTKSPIDSDVEIIHSTWEDNLFLDKDYIQILKDLIKQDVSYYNVYTLGLWGAVQRRIFTNFEVIPALPTMEKAHWGYGLDYGLVNPSGIVKAYLFQDKIYAEEKLYKTGLTNSDLIETFSHLDKGDIWADPTAKMLTEEIRRAGYPAFDGHKGVKETIDLCQRQTIYIPQNSPNLIREMSSYQWKADKDGNVLTEPVKYNDHLVDCLRYVVWGLTERFGFPTQRPRQTEAIKSLTFGAEEGINKKILERWMNHGV